MTKKMNYLGLFTALFLTTSFTGVYGQKDTLTKEEKLSYYEQRAKEDAEYEQSLTLESEDDEADFWEDQKEYEKDLKQRDRKAYKAYMKGKRDAYAEHARHCGDHCHHSEHYHHHASFYYSYHHYGYPRWRSTISTGVRIATPSVRVGIF